MEGSPGVVLHVDDDADARESLGVVLRMSGYRHLSAANAASALSVARQISSELDVLIVDYHLGEDLTGTDVAESITRFIGRSVPTIVLTGDPANAEIPLLPKSPVWLMRKPADPDLLLASLPALVDLNRAVQRLDRRHD